MPSSRPHSALPHAMGRPHLRLHPRASTPWGGLLHACILGLPRQREASSTPASSVFHARGCAPPCLHPRSSSPRCSRPEARETRQAACLLRSPCIHSPYTRPEVIVPENQEAS